MLVTYGHFYDPLEAHILRERLEAEHIPAMVVGDGYVRLNWPWAVALRGAKICVPVEFREQADEIVAAYTRGDFAADVDAEVGTSPPSCPACRSTSHSRTVPLREKLLAISVFLVSGATFPTEASRFRCEACGTTWDGMRGNAG